MVGDLSFAFRVLNAFRSLAFYLWKMLAPIGLSPLYPYPRSVGTAWIVQSLLALLGTAILSVVCLRFRGKYPFVVSSWFFYLITLSPVLGFVQVGSQAAADRFLYLPCLALFLPLAAGLSVLGERRRWIGMTVGILLCLAWGFGTVKQCAVWKDSITVFERIVKLYPGVSHYAHSNLAAYYAKDGRLDDSLREYERAAALPPPWSQAKALAGKGAVLADLGREDEAERVLREALELDPRCAQAHRNLWVLYGRQRKFPEALTEAKAASLLEPNNSENYELMATIYLHMKKQDEAGEAYRRCVELDPTQPRYRMYLGGFYMYRGLFEQAVSELQAAHALLPTDAKLLALLIQACEKAGKNDLMVHYNKDARAMAGLSEP